MWRFDWRFWVQLVCSLPFVACLVIAYYDHAFGRVALYAVVVLLNIAAAFMTAWRGRHVPRGD